MRPCCEKQENLEQPVRLSEDLTVTQCRVCGANHYEMTVDPLRVGVEATEL